jgi:hypothetical protein
MSGKEEMARQDKDAAIDGLLRRRFAADKRSGAGANAQECPSADLLAAYYERSLDAAEMARYELHFAECARCREQLAALVRADEAVGAGTGAEKKGATGWSWFGHQWWLVPVAGTLVFAIVIYAVVWPGLTRRRAVAPEEVAVSKAEPPLEAAPAASAALDETTKADKKTSVDATTKSGTNAAARNGVARTESKMAAPMAPSHAGTAAGHTSNAGSARSTRGYGAGAGAGRGVVGGVAGGVARTAPAPTVAAKQSEAENRGAVAASAPPPAPLPTAQPTQQPPQQAPAPRKARAQPAAMPPNAAAAEVQETTQSAAMTPQAKKDGDLPRLRGETGRDAGRADVLAQAPEDRELAPEQGAPAPPGTATAGGRTTTAGSKTTTAGGAKTTTAARNAHGFGAAGAVKTKAVLTEEKSDTKLIPTPDPNYSWRVAEGGFVEHTENGGATWTGVAPAPDAQLLAGSAPAPRTCWLVGREGVILVTTDAVHWKTVTPPTQGDFKEVSAASGQQAIVTAGDGRKFSTRDAGKTWQAMPAGGATH